MSRDPCVTFNPSAELNSLFHHLSETASTLISTSCVQPAASRCVVHEYLRLSCFTFGVIVAWHL